MIIGNGADPNQGQKMTKLETIEEIKAAVDAGKRVDCMGGGYHVLKSGARYVVAAKFSGYRVGLHGRPGSKYENVLNGTDFVLVDA